MFVIESAIAKAANTIGVTAREIQERNLLKDGDEFPYGQIVAQAEAKNAWTKARQYYKLDQIEREIESFNSRNKHFKKGMAVMPIC